MGGDYFCWEATGVARATFIQIADEIKSHLEKVSESVPQAVTWTMYMIGKTRETAEPIILFCCRELASRKQVRTAVEESGILQRYPGVRVGDASRPPDFDQLVQLAGGLFGSPPHVESMFGGSPHVESIPRELEFRCEPDGDVYASRLTDEIEVVMGKRLLVTSFETLTRQATIGGIVHCGSRYFYLTANHVFDTPLPIPTTENDDHFDFDIGDETDQDTDDFIDSTSKGSLTPERADYSSSDECVASVRDLAGPNKISMGNTASVTLQESLPYNQDWKDSEHALKTSRFQKSGGILVGHLLRPQGNAVPSNLDYALIEIHNTYFQQSKLSHMAEDQRSSFGPYSSIRTISQNTAVITLTGSGKFLKGTVSGTSAYTNSPGTNSFLEMWTIRLDGKLEEGDCGSWVVGADRGGFFGHIVAGDPKSGVASIVPAYRIVQDAKERYGLQLLLPANRSLVGEGDKRNAETARRVARRNTGDIGGTDDGLRTVQTTATSNASPSLLIPGNESLISASEILSTEANALSREGGPIPEISKQLNEAMLQERAKNDDSNQATKKVTEVKSPKPTLSKDYVAPAITSSPPRAKKV